jgi:hypothetical protein
MPASEFWIEPGDEVSIGRYWSDDSIANELKTWKGFGKTVEGMDKHLFQVVGTAVHFRCGDSMCQDTNHDGVWHINDDTDLITATHLAALEALK